ncbi:hypothetical protein P8452_43402 [Trifolium repens]|nr:hypothetical protein P8452_43402 [Trifolium repens]
MHHNNYTTLHRIYIKHSVEFQSRKYPRKITHSFNFEKKEPTLKKWVLFWIIVAEHTLKLFRKPRVVRWQTILLVLIPIINVLVF